MKRYIYVIALMCLFCIGISAQTKVLERSAKKAPEWLNTAVDGHLVVTVTAGTLADAQVKALSAVTERIILSVASNVSVSQSNVSSEVITESDATSRDEFERISKIKSANLPFLKGISQTKINGVYWQHVRDKATNKEYYEYSIKYPFTKLEQRTLQAEFEKLDAEKTAEYKELEEKINQIESVDEIKSALTQLAAMKAYFFDDVRLQQVDGLTKRYRQLYDALTMVGTFEEKGKYRCQVLLDGNPVRVSKLPTVKSNCAGQIQVRPSNGSFLITYDAADCLPEEENFLDIQLRIEGKKLEHKAYLSEAGGAGVNDKSFSVVPEGKLILSAEKVDVATRTLTNISVRLTLNNRSGVKFGLKSIELHVPGLAVPLVFDDVDAIYSTKGIFQVKAKAEGDIAVRAEKNSALSFVQGVVTIVNPSTGALENVKLSLPYSANWE